MKDKPQKKSKEAVKAYHKKNEPIPSDVFGSYTGITKDGDPPVQDADDI